MLCDTFDSKRMGTVKAISKLNTSSIPKFDILKHENFTTIWFRWLFYKTNKIIFILNSFFQIDTMTNNIYINKILVLYFSYCLENKELLKFREKLINRFKFPEIFLEKYVFFILFNIFEHIIFLLASKPFDEVSLLRLVKRQARDISKQFDPILSSKDLLIFFII
ncbi:hypothetical protein BpHYR1_039981 [Brachionus plicatilis]|uniref:Uncharacterized protein n=1 Tax=Brachionus plicatilis TaxID=10195 RepID=A0A3M7SIE3_BRAPC|nr:hypothetical protein BpHYR1_039981 [Brachionus plicatilis]